MKNKVIVLMFLFIIFLIITVTTYANSVSSSIYDNFYRLHIIANSDSQKDQELKLKVRDGILEYMNQLNFDNKSDVILFINKHISDIKLVAKSILLENGFDYEVNIEAGNFYFPTKSYSNISLPAGFYDAIKIEIGDSNGQNWWCSLFPPLCFVDISSGMLDNISEELLKEDLSEEGFSLISSTSGDVKFKFKLIELLNEKKIL